jgi:hypothetical protein
MLHALPDVAAVFCNLMDVSIKDDCTAIPKMTSRSIYPVTAAQQEITKMRETTFDRAKLIIIGQLLNTRCFTQILASQ